MKGPTQIAAALGLVAWSGHAHAQDAEIGYPQGSLAYEAITSANYAEAESRLAKESQVRGDDPAYLLNFGHVLAKTGRLAEAAAMFERAARARDVNLVLADGRVMSSREAARRALQSVSVGGPEPSDR